jgi:hypothetical protein
MEGTKDKLVARNRKNKGITKAERAINSYARLVSGELHRGAQEEHEDTMVAQLKDMLEDLSLSSRLNALHDVVDVSTKSSMAQPPAISKEAFAQVTCSRRYLLKSLEEENTSSPDLNIEKQTEQTSPPSECKIEREMNLDWQEQIKKLEKRVELNRKYEADLDTKANQFLLSAVMVPTGDDPEGIPIRAPIPL